MDAGDFDLETLDLIALDRDLASRSFRAFVEIAWPYVEKQAFVPNWHIDATCTHLEALSAEAIRQLIINQPPGTSKSLITSVLFPAWEWACVDAGLRWIWTTYGASIARRDGVRMRNLIESDWYRERWPHVVIPRQNTRSATEVVNSAGGARYSTTVHGASLGKHAHRIGVDDPIKPEDTRGSRAALATEIDYVIDWWGGTMSTRQADSARTAKVVVMQRLHEKDLAGYCEKEEDGWVVLRLPMRFEAKFASHNRWTQRKRVIVAQSESETLRSTATGALEEVEVRDPRVDEGDLLDPVRFPEAEVAKLERLLGDQAPGQLQQRPTRLGGRVFRKDRFQYWGTPTTKYPTLPENCRLVQIWDCTFKGAEGAKGKKRSYVCGQVWAQVGADCLLVDQERGQWELMETIAAVHRLCGRWPRAFRKYVEDAANGPAVVSTMKKKVGGWKLVSPGGGSEARASAAAVFFGDETMPGNVYLPHVSVAPWIVTNEREMLAFPLGANDDTVDCLTHAVVILAEGAASALAKAMENVSQGGGGGLVA